MKHCVAALVLSALLNTCAVAQVVPVRPPTGPPAVAPTSTSTPTQAAVLTTTTADSGPLPSPGYLLKDYRNGTATESAAFDSRYKGGCITRFHLDSDKVPQFENDLTLCGREKDMTTQFSALFKLGKYDEIRADLRPDGIYEIQVHSITPEKRRDGGDANARNKKWSFTYQGVGAVVLPSSKSSVVPSTSTAVKSSTAASSASESPVPSTSVMPTDSVSAEPVAPSSQLPVPTNLYQAGASTASVLTFAGVAAVALLF
ncbi:hypothetical protein BJ741DRAFT_587883 [Chytriomyces cf. hyalinus JEL632]|nr:hypothetical protein BJ741DRAFT_587883 [Chytriomyces cf. hyalinus JEL632]